MLRAQKKRINSLTLKSINNNGDLGDKAEHDVLSKGVTI